LHARRRCRSGHLDDALADVLDIWSHALELFQDVTFLHDLALGVFEEHDGDVFVCTTRVALDGRAQVHRDALYALG
jgi:hypothetical protein